MKDPRTRESRGFAFVTFEEVSDAQSAMSALSGTTLDNRTISVELAKRGRARTRECHLFLTDIYLFLQCNLTC